MNCLRPGLSILLALSAAGPLVAEPRLESLEQRAREGDVRAMIAAGYAHANGEGVERDRARAAPWYEQAARRGSVEACLALGLLHWFGVVLVEDAMLEAIHREAAERGDAYAQFRLGLTLGHRAPEWLAQAAAQGQPDAQLELAKRLLAGLDDGGRDPVAAVKWLKAAAASRPEAKFLLARATRDGEGTIRSQSGYLRLLREAAEAGWPEAQAEWGFALSNGTGVPVDEAAAITWWQRAEAPRPLSPTRKLEELQFKAAGRPPLDAVRAHAWLNLASSRDYRIPHSPTSAQELLAVIDAELTADERARAEELAGQLLAECFPAR